MPTKVKKAHKILTANDADNTGVQCRDCGHRWPEDDLVDGYCGYCQCQQENETSKEASR